MSELSLNSLNNGKSNINHTHVKTKGIAMCFINPEDNAESPRYVIENESTLKQIKVLASTVPTASTTVTLYKNNVLASTFSFSTDKFIYDVSPNISLVVGDVLYVKMGAVNGLVNANIQLTVSE